MSAHTPIRGLICAWCLMEFASAKATAAHVADKHMPSLKPIRKITYEDAPEAVNGDIN